MTDRARASLVVCLFLSLVGCAALRDDLQRAESAYDQARYDDALVWLEDLEDDTSDMELDMRARYYYLRGMTAYRLGERDAALHYLALTREVAGDDPARALGPRWGQTMERTLVELTPNTATYRAQEEAGPQ